MNFFRFKKSKEESKSIAKVVPKTAGNSIFNFYNSAFSVREMRLYDELREKIPIIDAAICKIVRLIGDFSVVHEDIEAQNKLNYFLRTVKVGGLGIGIDTFLSVYVDQLLTYGTAIGEMVVDWDNFEFVALYNASLEDVELKQNENPLEVEIYRNPFKSDGKKVENPDLILLSSLNIKPGNVYGESILKGLPFVSEILHKIYETIGKNWQRVGEVRYAVTYNPGSDSGERTFAKERAMAIADEWSKAMRSNDVNDFVAVGDVQIKVIGADNQILDSQVPVRQLLEQIIAKLGIPPFLLGLSWSTTEKMSSQQADILTSELEFYRRKLTPIILKICSLFLRMNGYSEECEVLWGDINLQDAVELSRARLQNARAEKMELENKKMRRISHNEV